jgi:hypothetical protein
MHLRIFETRGHWHVGSCSYIFILLLSIVTLRPSPVPGSTIVSDAVRLVGNGSVGPYWLSGFFILKSSESVTLRGRALNCGTDYIVDYNAGSISFSRPLSPGDSIAVCFRRLGFALLSRWTTRDGRANGSTVSSPPVAYTLPPGPAAAGLRPGNGSPEWSRTGIQWEGFKSLSFSAANRGERNWSQGLELSVRGELSPGLQLTAAVTDRAVGGQDWARTSADGIRLGTLDRLFIEARSRRFYGRWGELALADPAAGSALRRATGIEARWGNEAHAVTATVARPHGEWTYGRVALCPGVSGPYRLATAPSWAGIVPGSLTAWLDGERLDEGDSRDYVVDWARGTITLMPRRAIASQSVLVVEFEQALDAYERTLAGSSWSWSNAAQTRRHSLAIDWEGDDPSAPLSGTLTEAQRAQLARDASGQVRVPAAERVADDQGDYRLDISTGGDSIFVYVGPGQGDWRARFQWVGAGLGRYHHLADEAYEYVGKGVGDYEPTVTLNAPTSRLAVSESLALPLGHTGRLVADWRGTAVDRNRLASGATALFSDHRVGLLLGRPDTDSGSAGLGVQWLRNAGSSGLTGVGERGDLQRFVKRWGLRSALNDSASNEYDLETTIPLGRTNTLRAAGGYWHNAQMAAWCRLVGIKLAPLPGLLAHGEWNHRDARTGSGLSPDRNDSYLSTLRLARRRAAIEIGWHQSGYKNTGGAFESAVAYAGTRWVTASLLGLEARHSWETARDSTVSAVRRTHELSVSCPVAALGGMGGGELTVARGERATGSGSYEPYYRGRLSGRWQPLKSMAVYAEMTLSHLRAGVQRERFLPTRPGLGQYRYERGEYIPDPHGDFRRVLVEETDTETSAYEGHKQVSLSWWPAWSRWRWSVDLQREVHGRYSTVVFQPGHWAIPWASLEKSLLPGAELMVRDAHKVSVRPNDRTELTATVARERIVFASEAGAGGGGVSQSRRAEARMRRELEHDVYVETAAQYQRRERTGVAAMALDADARALLFAVGGNLCPAVGVAIESRRRVDREFRRGDGVRLWGVNPSVQMRFSTVAITARSDFTWVVADTPGHTFSPLMVDGRPVGFSATESGELRWQLPGRVTLNVRLSGDHRPDEPDRWRVDVESVARF